MRKTSSAITARSLPVVQTAVLDTATVEELLRDISSLADDLVIRLRFAGDLQSASRALSMEEAWRLLQGGAASVQVRYRFQDTNWCDSLIPGPGGYRFVRVAVSE
ncbi:MAG: hypothetical protein R3E12_16820 [Candidatus Eisenbacteria bacterium]